MDLLYPCCAGLDVHKETVVACARTQQGSAVDSPVETFGTTTGELLRLSEWLSDRGCTHVALEATGVYWKPVWHVLEGSFELVLVNAAHVRNVPGRKTDVSDATWLADLLAHGLLRGSFVPPEPIQELRALTRTRKQLVREKASHVQRIQKVLEDANVKLTLVLTDIMGLSGRKILHAIARGETSPADLSRLASPRVKASRKEIAEALRGRVTKHHRFLLNLHLDHIESLESAIANVDSEVGEVLRPFREAAERLMTMPGVSDTVAQVIVSEIGNDMSRFPTAGHLISWAGLCPRSDESAGKRRATRIRKGAPWLKTVLVSAAWSAVRTKDTFLRTKFHRLQQQRGSRKAIVAIASKMLQAAYHMLRDNVDYRELGPDYLDHMDRETKAQKLVKKLRQMGYEVDVRSAA